MSAPRISATVEIIDQKAADELKKLDAMLVEFAKKYFYAKYEYLIEK